MSEVPPPDFLCNVRKADFFFSSLWLINSPNLALSSQHLECRKCVALITFTHLAFDLLSANYHNVHNGSLRRMRQHLLFCVIVIAFLISEVKHTDSMQGERPWWTDVKRSLKKITYTNLETHC